VEQEQIIGAVFSALAIFAFMVAFIKISKILKDE